MQSCLERSRILSELLKGCLSGQRFTVDGFEYRELIGRRGSRRENSLSETRVRDDTTPRPSQGMTCIRRRLSYETSEMLVERNAHVVLLDDVLGPEPARCDVLREERTDLRCNLSHECHLSYWLGLVKHWHSTVSRGSSRSSSADTQPETIDSIGPPNPAAPCG